LTAPAHFAGRTLAELNSDHDVELEVLLIKRGPDLITNPGQDERVEPGDELLLVGAIPEIDAFAVPRHDS
jgi:uncharacterized protein with PhoU and TrkA domain